MKYISPCFQESAKLESRDLETIITTSAGWTLTSSCRGATGAGSMPGTTAGSGAWTSSLLRPHRSMTGSRASWTVRIVIMFLSVDNRYVSELVTIIKAKNTNCCLQTQDNLPTSSTLAHFILHTPHVLQPMFPTSGPPGVSVTLMGVTDLISSPRTSTAGSGLPTRSVITHSDNIYQALTTGDQVPMPPTNSTRRFHDWSPTGGLRVPQPDNREETQLHGDTESCMAVLNNYYGDGEELVRNDGAKGKQL